MKKMKKQNNNKFHEINDFIFPSIEDSKIIINEIKNVYHKCFPNRKFNFYNISKKRLYYVIIKEIVKTFDENCNCIEEEIEINNFGMNTILTFLTEDTKKYILEKYKDYTLDYTDQLKEFIKSFDTFIALKDVNTSVKIEFNEIKRIITISNWHFSKNAWSLGNFKYFKTYTLEHYICSKQDFEQIKKYYNECLKTI